MASLVVLYSLAVKPVTALSGRIAGKAQLGWQLFGSFSRPWTVEN
jgi:hypothetical protein